MNYKYRVIGRVSNSFILRGHYNKVGDSVELLASSNELDFIKDRLENAKVIEIEKEQDKPADPVLIKKDNEEELENDKLQEYSSHRTNKSKNKAKIQPQR